MIRITFRIRSGLLCGFRIAGHAGAGTEGEDIVCAAVSSAAYMVANTVTEILHSPADITVDEGLMDLTVPDAAPCQTVLAGLELHLKALRQQYPQRIQITTMEV